MLGVGAAGAGVAMKAALPAIAKFAGGALSTLGMGAASSLLGGGISQGFTAKQRKNAYKLWRKQLKLGPTFHMEGLRKAGLNPILAAGAKGLSQGNVPFQMQQINTSPVASATEQRLLGSQQNLITNQTKLANSQRVAADATAHNQAALANKHSNEAGSALQHRQALEELYRTPEIRRFLESLRQGGNLGGMAGLGDEIGDKLGNKEEGLIPNTGRALEWLLRRLPKSSPPTTNRKQKR